MSPLLNTPIRVTTIRDYRACDNNPLNIGALVIFRIMSEWLLFTDDKNVGGNNASIVSAYS